MKKLSAEKEVAQKMLDWESRNGKVKKKDGR
jgi:hypothetical protein